jgi:hypothetical protein
MRLVEVVLAGVLLGLIAGLLNMQRPDAAGAGAGKVVSERMTWLWAPAMARRSSVQ